LSVDLPNGLEYIMTIKKRKFMSGETRQRKKFCLFPVRIDKYSLVWFEYVMITEVYSKMRYPGWIVLKIERI
jgi:hypothetical protein